MSITGVDGALLRNKHGESARRGRKISLLSQPNETLHCSFTAARDFPYFLPRFLRHRGHSFFRRRTSLLFMQHEARWALSRAVYPTEKWEANVDGI